MLGNVSHDLPIFLLISSSPKLYEIDIIIPIFQRVNLFLELRSHNLCVIVELGF